MRHAAPPRRAREEEPRPAAEQPPPPPKKKAWWRPRSGDHWAVKALKWTAIVVGGTIIVAAVVGGILFLACVGGAGVSSAAILAASARASEPSPQPSRYTDRFGRVWPSRDACPVQDRLL